MEYNLLNKIADKMIGFPASWGTQYNLVFSEDYYKRFEKELKSKYPMKNGGINTYKSGIERPNGNTFIGIKSYKFSGYTVNIVLSDVIETWKLIPIKKYELSDEQYSDSTDRGVIG